MIPASHSLEILVDWDRILLIHFLNIVTKSR